MNLYLNLLLIVMTLAGGALPLYFKAYTARNLNVLLAFSGSFLLSVTFLHLLPETYEELHHEAGYWVLAGFFLQLIIQKFTHGAEHGHTHLDAHHHIPVTSIMLGMLLHTFMEGIPLGFHYRQSATAPSLYLAVAAHKFPEAILIGTIALAAWHSKRKAWWVVVIFACITPLAGLLAAYSGVRFYALAQAVVYIIPIVAGSFLHISTTIFFESGTRHHMLSRNKLIAMLLGVLFGLSTLFLGHGHQH